MQKIFSYRLWSSLVVGTLILLTPFQSTYASEEEKYNSHNSKTSINLSNKDLRDFKVRCEQNQSNPCIALVGHYLSQQKFNEVIEFGKKACDLQIAEGCFAVAFALLEGASPEKFKQENIKTSMPYLEKACLGQVGGACSLIALLYSEHAQHDINSPYEPDHDKYRKYARLACEYGELNACKLH